MYKTKKWIKNLWRWADIHNISHEILPRDEVALLNLTELNLTDARIYEKVDSIEELLQEMDGKIPKNTNAITLPKEICDLSNLKKIDACMVNLNAIPDAIGKLDKLEVLDLSLTHITGLPLGVFQLKSLKNLVLTGTPLILSSSQKRSLEKYQEVDCEIEINYDEVYILEEHKSQRYKKHSDELPVNIVYSQKPRKCPQCEHAPLAKVVYGYPTPEAFEGVKRGEIVLAGCTVFLNMPQADWGCPSCNLQLYKRKSVEPYLASWIKKKNYINDTLQAYNNLSVYEI